MRGRPSPRASTSTRGRDLDNHRASRLHQEDVSRGSKSHVSRIAEAKARNGETDDSVGHAGSSKKGIRRAVSRAIEELDALDKPAEVVHLTPEEEEKKPQAFAAEAGENSNVRETDNRFASFETQQSSSNFSPLQATPGDRFTPQAVPDNSGPQTPPTGNSSSESGKNRRNLEANVDRFTPAAERGSEGSSGEDGGNNLGPESSRFSPGTEQQNNTGEQPVTPVKSKYAIPEVGSEASPPEARDKNGHSLKRKDFAAAGGNKHQFSNKNRNWPKETSQAMKDPNQTPSDEGNMTSGAAGSAAKNEGRATGVKTEPKWLAWYNTHPWRQEALSEYGEEPRPSRAAFGL